MRLLYALLAALPVLVAGPARAFERHVTGTVTHVSDGDTYWLQLPDGVKLKIRMMRIDAPEICQRGGVQARDALKARIVRKQVEVELLRKDDFGRWLANTTLNGQDVAAAQVQDGYAWADTYRGRWGIYSAEEAAARKAGRGVWALQPGQEAAQRPRDFRHAHGSCFMPTPVPTSPATPIPASAPAKAVVGRGQAAKAQNKAGAGSQTAPRYVPKPLVPLNR